MTQPFQDPPLLSIQSALKGIFTAPPYNLKYVILGWPDTKWFNPDGNKPGLIIVEAAPTTGKAARSQLQPFTQDTNNIYFEYQRLQLMLQLTLITSTPDERDSLGWSMMQYLTKNRQIALPDGQYSLFRLHGDFSPEGEANYYMRHLTFQAQARVLVPVAGSKVTSVSGVQTIQ